MSVKLVKSLDELRSVVSASKIVVVDATASWCGPCTMVYPKIQALAQKYPQVTFIKFDIEQSEEIADYFNITSMPTFIFYVNGEMQNERVLGADAGKVERFIRGFLSTQ